jgi:general secretion pathway protein K
MKPLPSPRRGFSPRPPAVRRRGLALIIVLWAIAVMSLAVIGLVRLGQAGLADIADTEKYHRALNLAESGMAVALSPQVTPSDPLLRQKWNADESFAVEIQSEQGRLSVNSFLREENRDVWRRLLQGWGLPSADADRVFDSLMDWIHPGSGRRLNGAALEDYQRAGLPYGPTGKPFASFEEMEQVMNFQLLTRRQPDWRQYFSLWSSGALDLNAAPADLIAAVTGADLSRARAFVQYRNGPDGVPFTDDDRLFADLQEAGNYLRITPATLDRLRSQLTLQSNLVHVRSHGLAYGKTITLDAVALRGARSPTIYAWNQS